MLTHKQILPLIDAYIKGIKYPEQPDGLYEPVRYVLGEGGKRMRCVLLIMAYNLFRDDIESVLTNAAAIETYHNFTLLHDDLMDNADKRRGKPTVHKKWNPSVAILSGDAMLILAYKLMYQGRAIDCPQAVKTFTDVALGVCDGQQYDMEFEQRNDVSEDEYMEMIRLKTSVLLAGALKIGAQLAGASEEDAQALYDFGESVGLAFQLQDDLLDVYGDPKVFGKNIGGDIVENKKTFMLINALKMSEGETREQLAGWISRKEFDKQEKIKAVTDIYDRIGIKKVCSDKINSLFDKAFQCLGKVGVEDGKKQYLRDFALEILGREK